MQKMIALSAMMMLGASSMAAQDFVKGLNWAAEAGVGTELELGLRAQYQFNQYLAWDVLHAKYAYDYNDYGDFSEFSLTTGLRGFTPTFGPGLKAFAAIDLGYGLTFDSNWHDNNFAMDFTTGLYVWKGLYMGYGLGLMHHHGNHKDHLFRIGYEF